MAPSPLSDVISEIVAKLPDWLRRDLTSDRPTMRRQAEEALVAMLSAAISAQVSSTGT